MAEVTLVIKADTTSAVKGINDVQKATQKLHDTATQGEKREKGILEEIDATLQRLQKARQKAFSYDEIAKFNKKIEETKQNLQEYEQAGLKVENTTTTMTQSIGKWVLGLGLAAKALELLKKAFLDTQQGIQIFSQAGAALNQVLYNIVNGIGSWNTNVAESIRLAKLQNDLRIKDNFEMLKSKQLMREYNELYTEGVDQTITGEEKVRKLTKAKELYIQAVNIEIESTKEQLRLAMEVWKLQPASNTAMERAFALRGKLEDLNGQLAQGTRRLVTRITSEIQQQLKEQEDALNRIKGLGLKLGDAFAADQAAAEEERQRKLLAVREKFQQMSIKLIDDYDRSNIESLTGVDKLRAQRAFGLKQLDELKKQMQALGKLTAEQESMFVALGENVQKAFLEGLTKEGIQKAETKNIFSDFIDKLTPNKLIKPKTVPKPDQVTIWGLLGINVDTEDGKKQMEALVSAKDTMLGVIDEIYQARVDDATRRRELLDTQVSETQQELEAEMELMKAGYANNVDWKRKELEALKKQRDIALKKEEEAIKRQRQLDTITQISSLITASAQTFRAFPGPLLPIAIAVVAAMFAAFAATKAKAVSATKLASGGSGTDTGIVKGRSHAYGGEHFLNHVEVEGGESWGVLSIPATQKFGKVFHHVVSSFNRGEIPNIMPVNRINNNVMVENSGPNSRLDQVVREQRKLNARLSGESVQDFGNVKIIRKGESIRTIKR